MAEELKAGDVVQLKSGGPLMTVGEITRSNRRHCYWFDGVQLKNTMFDTVTLRRPDPPKKKPRPRPRTAMAKP